MSWITRRSELHTHDWGLLELSPRPSEAFKISKPFKVPHSNNFYSLTSNNGPNRQANRWHLTNEDDIRQWLDVSNPCSINRYLLKPFESIDPVGRHKEASCIDLIMASKTDSLDELPFTQTGFETIMNKLNVHGSIVRAINRNTSCAFVTIPFTWKFTNAAIPSISEPFCQTSYM